MISSIAYINVYVLDKAGVDGIQVIHQDRVGRATMRPATKEELIKFFLANAQLTAENGYAYSLGEPFDLYRWVNADEDSTGVYWFRVDESKYLKGGFKAIYLDIH